MKVAKIVNQCWNALCALKDQIKNFSGPIDYCSIKIGADSKIGINQDLAPQEDCYHIKVFLQSKDDFIAEKVAYFYLEPSLKCALLKGALLPPEILQMLKLYLPYCFSSLYAREKKRCFTVSHFAQSLDGYIATVTGDSKWIGNDLNLTHAHRMRALCDAVLIGKNTLCKDSPKLTVRHVKGSNPTRIVIGASIEDIQALGDFQAAPIIVINDKDSSLQKNVTVLPLDQCSCILRELYTRNILSLYIEGGATTTAKFLQEHCLDILQLHISPLVFGSGVASFPLAKIDQVAQAISFHSHQFLPVGDGNMFVGYVDYKK